MEIFKTTNLIVRHLNETDLGDFYELESDPDVFRYLDHSPYSSVDEVREELQQLIVRHESPGNDFWVWAGIRSEDHAFVGTGAIILNEEKDYEIGYRLMKKYWGRGYASELSHGLINYGFEKMHLNQLSAVACEKNVASIRLLHKCMSWDRQEFNPNFNDFDHFFAIDRDEWRKK